MANARSGGEAPPGSSASPATGNSARRETRSSSIVAAAATNLRRSTRENKGKRKSALDSPSTTPSQRPTRATRDTPSAKKPREDSTPSTRKSARFKVSPSPASKQQDSNAADNTTAEKRNNDPHSVGGLSKKQKRLCSKSYIALFKAPSEQSQSLPVVASPDREDVENASKMQVENNGADLVDIQSDGDEQVNQEPSTVAANKVLEDQSSDLHETIASISKRDELRIGCLQSEHTPESHMPEICSLNKVAESIPTMEAGEQTNEYSNQNSLPEVPNGPCSTSHYKETNKRIGDGDSIGIQGACTSIQTEAVQCDEADQNDHMCAGCKSSSISDILKCCDGKGCKQYYHLSCIVPPLERVPPGTWLCVKCRKKKIQFGVYSVSEGIDSLWDFKDGQQNGKQYFVKYKNLAHAHNRWVSESDLVDSTPQGRDLIAKFSKKIRKDKTIRWKQEWAEPHRLLKKRSLMPPKEAEEFFNSLGDKFVFCNTEWLVKWKDLGYEHATWELETSSFLCTPEAVELKRSYESRCEAARKAPVCGKLNKSIQVKEGIFQKLPGLPDGCPPGLDDDHSINQLREFWHNSRGAIFVDDQERVIKTILFVMSILPYICRPLLIISTSASLSLWEAKFNRLAASINVVVYNGDTDVRKSIQDLEFYDNGSMMLQVLLSHPDAILEDIQDMENISWEAVLVDDCQSSRVSKCLSQLKRLPTNFRMVLLSSPIKENIPEYINLLSFLNPEENDILSVSNSDSGDTVGTLAALKAKLACYIAFERKADSSIFSEYWVPARLSQVQLEMYCYTLLSNSPALRSHSKTDSVGALRNILVSLRKCCDHPYLVDQSLQISLTKGHPLTDILDIGVCSSGKLLLLERMLQELRTEGLRVLILCQSGGGSGNPMGDILDDFIRQRFGYESYERVERGLQAQKKQIAMSIFNDMKKGRFIFLMDSRACVPSVKLSSIDAVIIYSSDWNPVNDLRALQRISVESKSERVPIFRLYSSCTVEEKALILAKHDQILDSNIENITPSLSHCLLSWGASFLFNRLDKFQNHNYSGKGSDGDKHLLDNVVSEFSTILSTTKVEVSTKSDNAVISQAHLRGSFYSRDIAVIGEREEISSPDGDLLKFWAYWSDLLHGRSPQWQHISEPAQRSRRKIHNMEKSLVNIEEQSKLPAEETDEARIKRRRLGGLLESSSKAPPVTNKDTLLSQNNNPSSSHQISVDDTWQELETNNLHGAQQGLHVQLKPELLTLYRLLELPESVKSLCEELLDYILKNHQVSQEPKGILHAFNIALCWRAASLVKHKVNRRESLALSVKNLNYECNERLVSYVYDKLRILKKKFRHRAEEISKLSQSTSASNLSLHEPETSTKLINDESILSKEVSVNGGFENGSHQDAPGDDEIVSGEKEHLCDTETRRGKHLSRDEVLSRIFEKRKKLVDKVFSLREMSIQDKHSKEVSLLDMHRQREVAKLRGACMLVVKHLRESHIDQEDMVGKINLIIEWFTMLFYAFLEHMRCQRNKLDMQQSAAWTKESQLKEQFLQSAKSGHLDHVFDQHIPLPDSHFSVEEFSYFREEIGSRHVHAASLTPCSLDDNSAIEIALVRSVYASDVSSTVETGNGPAEVFIQRSPSEVVDLTVNGMHHNISDGIDSQGDASLAVQHSVINNPLIDDSANQESSGGNHRSTEHVEEESSATALLQVGTNQRLDDAATEVNTENSEASVVPHLQIPASTAPSTQAILPVSSEVETQRNIVTQSAGQSLAPSQLPQGELGQADLSGVVSAQPFQSERHLSIPVTSNPLETAQPDQSQPSQTDAAPNSAQSAQLFPVSSMMFNHPPIDDEPLKNEMHKLRLHMDTINKFYELKKSQLQMECNQEIEKVKRKYDLLIEESDSAHIQQKKMLDDIYEKVHRNQSLAEDFCAKFISTSATQAKTHSRQVHQTPQVSQQAPTRPSSAGSSASPVASSSACRPPVPRPSSAGSSASPVASSSACRPPVPRPSSAGSSASPVASSSACRPPVPRPPSLGSSAPPAASSSPCQLPVPRLSSVGSSASSVASASACRPPVPRPRVQLLQVDRPSSSLPQVPRPLQSSQVSQPVPAPSVPGNLFRTTSAPVGHLPTQRGSYGVQGELAPRAPAPHLQFRPPRSHPMPPRSQQQVPRPEATSASSRTQLSPVAQGTSLPSSSQATLLADPSTLDSHQPPLLAPGSSPSHLAQRTPNSALLGTASAGTTAAASSVPVTGRRIGASKEAGVQATFAGSQLLDLGSSSSSPRVGASVNGGDIDVVCLSDDDGSS